MYEKIETTEPRAKEARVMAEKLITIAKKNTIAARREARKVLPAPRVPSGMLSASGKTQKKMRHFLYFVPLRLRLRLRLHVFVLSLPLAAAVASIHAMHFATQA
jgi:hypothetical protein